MIKTISTTVAGFAFAKFTDRYGAQCSIQKSSLAFEDCIWLGIDSPEALIMSIDCPGDSLTLKLEPNEGSTATTGWKRFVFPAGVLLSGRMHLTREMAADLIPLLQHFVDTGDLPMGGGAQ